jgi:glycosyltransferase involved in cell wall biosynthesis
MQEIIPAIEKVWERVGLSKSAQVKIADVSNAKSPLIKKLTEFARKADYIVATASTPSVMRVMTHLRKNGITKPFLIYVHGDATSGFLAFQDLKDLLIQKDAFLVSCEADAAAVRYSFKNPNVVLLPFPLADEMAVEPAAFSRGDEACLPLLYIGRISEQKNLHTLFLSIWILKEFFNVRNITLDIYGAEDGYGSPNMASDFPSYLIYLKGLSEHLNIKDCIRWHGYKSRKDLGEIVKDNRFIFVSSTLHSDENFGASALASLMQGSQVVLTRWGGHPSFEKHFPNQLSLVPVHGSDGPFVNPFELAHAIKIAHKQSLILRDNIEVRKKAKKYFSIEEGAKIAFTNIRKLKGSSKPLEKTDLLQMLLTRRVNLKMPKRKLYFGYNDLLSIPYFRAYGMSERQEEFSTTAGAGKIIIPPWVHKYRHDIRVTDPHRGCFSFGDSGGDQTTVLSTPDRLTVKVPLKVASELVRKGFAFSYIEEKKSGISRPRKSSVRIISLSPEL